MDLDFTAEQRDFREEVRTWLAEHKPTEPRPPTTAGIREYDTAWQRTQYEGGWAGIAWPKEYGGRGLSLLEQLIWYEEYGRAGLPSMDSTFVGPQPRRADADRRARPTSRRRSTCRRSCAARSSGARASPSRAPGPTWRRCAPGRSIDGDDLVVTGQKIWTSSAHVADWQELLVRTDPAAPKHQRHHLGHLRHARTRASTSARSRRWTASADFCEVFYDEVRIPLANVVGELNDGWRVAMSTLSFERGTAFTAEPGPAGVDRRAPDRAWPPQRPGPLGPRHRPGRRVAGGPAGDGAGGGSRAARDDLCGDLPGRPLRERRGPRARS